MASHKLKIIETRYDHVVAQHVPGPNLHNVPMTAIAFHGERSTFHPDGLNQPLWWDEDSDTYHDMAPEDRPAPPLSRPIFDLGENG